MCGAMRAGAGQAQGGTMPRHCFQATAAIWPAISRAVRLIQPLTPRHRASGVQRDVRSAEYSHPPCGVRQGHGS